MDLICRSSISIELHFYLHRAFYRTLVLKNTFYATERKKDWTVINYYYLYWTGLGLDLQKQVQYSEAVGNWALGAGLGDF